MNNTLFDVQSYIAGKLSEDQQLSGKVAFLAENRRDIDFQIKQALGKQGIVGLVITPKASFLGKYPRRFGGNMIAWELPELEIDIVENVSINRGKPLSADVMTGQDASMRVFEVLCPLSGESEGQFCPVAYEQGEDGSLLVNKCMLKCAVYGDQQAEPGDTIVTLADGTALKFAWSGKITKEKFMEAGLLSSDGTWLSAVKSVDCGATIDQYIGNDCMLDCTSLESFDVGRVSADLGIGGGSFEGCTALTSFILPDNDSSSPKMVNNRAFKGCSSLQAVQLPDVYNIGLSAFAGCSSLESLQLSCKTYADGEVEAFAFANCTSLKNAVFPSWSVMTLGKQAFEGCSALERAELPAGLSSIGRDAFKSCPSLTCLAFEGKTLAEVKAMQYYPWGIQNTQNIHNIIGPDTRVKYAWSTSWDSLPLSGTLNSEDLPSRDGINYIGIGSSIDEIGYSTFSGMEFLRGVEIPTTVTTIGTQAFAGAEGMPDIEIPSSVQSIGSDAFSGCHSLSSVMFKGKTLEQVQAMENYPWGASTSVISCEL